MKIQGDHIHDFFTDPVKRILQCPLHPLRLLAKTLKNSDHQHQLEIMQAPNP